MLPPLPLRSLEGRQCLSSNLHDRVCSIIRAPIGVRARPSLDSEPVGKGRAGTRLAGMDMRLLLFKRVHSFHEAGKSARAIRPATGLGLQTVRKWICLKSLSPRQRMAPKSTTPSGFEQYLRRRWSEGCTHGRSLLAELREQGYTGSFSRLAGFLSPWRRAGAGEGAPEPQAMSAFATAKTPCSSRPPSMPRDPRTGGLISPIVAAALCVKPRGLLTDGQRTKVDALKSALPERWPCASAV